MSKWLLAGALLMSPISAFSVQAAETTRLTGDVIDTWCYYSGVMGGPEGTQGSAHRTCAVWCAAGGIPVGLLTEDGTVYMILGYEGEDPTGSDALLDVQSHRLTVDATTYQRDGINYATIDTVIEDAGIVNVNHDDWGTVPGFVIPELN